VAYHEKRRRDPSPSYLISKQDEGTLLFAIYEAHAQITAAWNLFPGNDDAPAETVAEATADRLDA
jgi:hypothetical protein